MRYIWDESKRRSNLAKHGLDFRDVVFVFDDPNSVIYIDTRFDYDEERLILIGALRNIIVTVIVYTEDDELRRIISFRKAAKQEIRRYYNGNS